MTNTEPRNENFNNLRLFNERLNIGRTLIESNNEVSVASLYSLSTKSNNFQNKFPAREILNTFLQKYLIDIFKIKDFKLSESEKFGKILIVDNNDFNLEIRNQILSFFKQLQFAGEILETDQFYSYTKYLSPLILALINGLMIYNENEVNEYVDQILNIVTIIEA